MKTMETKINASIFIIPNGLIYGNEMWSFEDYNKKLKSFGLEGYSPEDLFVEVWVTGSGSDNWACHCMPKPLCTHRGERFLEYLPVRLLEKLKEGDTFKISIHGKDVIIKAEQIPYRYRQFGPFDWVLKKLKQVKTARN